jgi:hypothetical protein
MSEFMLPHLASEVATAIEKALTSVQTINGVKPDKNGNVNGGGSGLSANERTLLLSLFKNAAYTANMSTTIAQLETLWSGNVPDVPVVPDLPDTDVSQSGNILSIVSGVTASQSGSVLVIA